MLHIILRVARQAAHLKHGLDLLLRHALGGLEDVGRVHEAGERVEGVVDLQVRRLQVRLDERLRRSAHSQDGTHLLAARSAYRHDMVLHRHKTHSASVLSITTAAQSIAGQCQENARWGPLQPDPQLALTAMEALCTTCKCLSWANMSRINHSDGHGYAPCTWGTRCR